MKQATVKKIELSFSDIQEAQKRIQDYIKKTSLQKSDFFSNKIGSDLFLKWETEQEIKSFKLRGALNKVFSLTEEERQHGLIAASAGNHAQGVSLAARYSNVPVRVVMMETASQTKINRTKELGAEVILKGQTYDESYEYAKSIQGESVFIHPFADSQVIAGQGTVVLEILEDQPDLESIIVPIGGGGLIAGVSLAVKHINPNCKVYGVVWQGTPSFCKKYHADKGNSCLCDNLVENDSSSRSGLTDGIAVVRSNDEIFNFCKKYIDDIACVTQSEISKTVVDVVANEAQVAEGSGLAALTAAIKYKNKWKLGKKSAVIVSGGNIDPQALSDMIKYHSG